MQVWASPQGCCRLHVGSSNSAVPAAKRVLAAQQEQHGSQSTAHLANASHTDMLVRAGIWPTDKELKPPQPAIALRPMTYRLLGQAVTKGVPTARLAPWFRKLSRVLPSVLMKMFHLHPPAWVRDCGGLLGACIPKDGPGRHAPCWQGHCRGLTGALTLPGYGNSLPL